MPKQTLQRNCIDTDDCIRGRGYIFLKGICPKVNVIARLEFELAFFDVAFEHVNHYTTGTSPVFFCLFKWKWENE